MQRHGRLRGNDLSQQTLHNESNLYGCFKGTNNQKDAGRPVVGCVFYDKYVRRNILVISLHAPYKGYNIIDNLQYSLNKTVAEAASTMLAMHHFVLAGDYNDWDYWDRIVDINSPWASALKSATETLYRR